MKYGRNQRKETAQKTGHIIFMYYWSNSCREFHVTISLLVQFSGFESICETITIATERPTCYARAASLIVALEIGILLNVQELQAVVYVQHFPASAHAVHSEAMFGAG